MSTNNSNWLKSSDSIKSKYLKACKKSQQYGFFQKLKWSSRLNRLFAVACCRNIWTLITDPRSQQAVLTAEKYADGLCTEKELNDARAAASAASAASAAHAAHAAYYAACYAACSAAYAAYAAYAACSAAYAAHAAYTARASSNGEQEWVNQSEILVSMILPELTFDSNWKTKTVIDLAQTMYEYNDFSAIPILADALQDANCNNETLLTHMRSNQSKFYRGCRIIDEILNKRT